MITCTKINCQLLKLRYLFQDYASFPIFLIISNSQLKILILTWYIYQHEKYHGFWTKKKFRPMLYRSAVFTLVFAALEKFMWHLCLTPLHSRVLFSKIPFALGHIPSTSAWHFCLLCMHFSTRSSQKFIQLDLLQKFLYK